MVTDGARESADPGAGLSAEESAVHVRARRTGLDRSSRRLRGAGRARPDVDGRGPLRLPAQLQVPGRPRLVEPAHGRRHRRVVQQIGLARGLGGRLRAARRRTPSSVSFVSVSVGSIIIASSTTSGKYTVDGWKPRSISALRDVHRADARWRVSRGAAVATNSCIGRPSGNASGKSPPAAATRGSSRSAPRSSLDLLEPVRAVEEHVRVGAHEHADVAVEAVHAADRSAARRVRAGTCRRVVALDARHRQERHERARPPRPGPPPVLPPPCGVANVLWVLMCTMSKPMSPGPALAHDRVQVRAVVVDEPADVVDDRRDLARCRSSNRPSVFGFVSIRPATSSSTSARRAVDVDEPARVRRARCTAWYPPRRTLAGFVPCAESGIRTFERGVPEIRVIGAHDQQPGQLAAGARGRLQGRPRHPRDLAERLLEPPEQLERPLRRGVGLERVQPVRSRATRPRSRRPSGCTSSCTSPAG